MRLLAVVLLLAGCAPEVILRPVMAPVDTLRVPKGSDVACSSIDWPQIMLPTTAAEQVEGRHADRAKADAALAECDRRRGAAVRAIRRR